MLLLSEFINRVSKMTIQTSDDARAAVKSAMVDREVNGVMGLTEMSPLSYERTGKVFRGDFSAKFGDYVDVMNELGYDVEFVKRGNHDQE